MEIFLTIVVSAIAGLVIGLLPGLPIWLGVFIVFPWIDLFTPAQIMVYWIGIAVGSQFFGSVSTLLLRVPGENSSLIYIQDTYGLDLQQRLDLVRQTAWGSAVATLISLAVVSVLYAIGSYDAVFQWTTSTVKFSVYCILILILIASADRRWWALLLLMIGLGLADKTNQALPIWILQVNQYISHVTVFSAMLSLIVIPEFLAYQKSNTLISTTQLKYSAQPIQWRSIFSGTGIGCISGLIPGMTATIGSISAYKLYKGSIDNRIIAAESANNSAIITALLPLLIIGIPITVDEIIVSNAFALKLLEMPAVFRQPAWFGLTLGWLTIATAAVFSILYFYASQRFLSFYIKFVDLMHGYLKVFYLVLVAGLIYFDLSTNAVNIASYLAIMLMLSAFGIWLKKNSINPLPMLLGILLGDSMIWSTYHVIARYF